jgi:hypothetical protein
MPEILLKNLLLEEYKTTFDHLHYVEAKRDRYAFGGITASGAIVVLFVKIFSNDCFVFLESSILFMAFSCVLCLLLGLLHLMLLKGLQ